MENYVITIARGFGSGGKEIGKMLSKELGIPCYENQILEMASDYSGIDKDEFMQVDEKLRGTYVSNWLEKVPILKNAVPMESEFVSDLHLFQIQAEIIRDLAMTQSCIIVGKCADHVLRNFNNVISVYIEAPHHACVDRICKRLNVTPKRAEELIKKTDKYRYEYYKCYAGGDWRNPINYDFTLNSDRIGWERCVELIKQYVSIRFGIDTEHPEKEADD